MGRSTIGNDADNHAIKRSRSILLLNPPDLAIAQRMALDPHVQKFAALLADIEEICREM
jgi:hypothetical protein